MARTQYYGIKFPITVVSNENTMVDLNRSKKDLVRSELMHVIFTPRGQRLRDPLFGTNLIQYIFNPNDGQTWHDVVSEIKDAIKRYVPDCEVSDVVTDVTEDGEGLICRVYYIVHEPDGSYSNDMIETTL